MATTPDQAIKTAYQGSGITPKNGDIATIDGQQFQYKDGTFSAVEGGSGTVGSLSETPPKWNESDDTRTNPQAGKYPNQMTIKTRSGHLIMFDDSRGAESVTIQHRVGSMVQIKPDGKVHVRANKGMHTVVFGENRMYVTGAYDITVDGAASITCDKDFNINSKNINITAREDINIKSKNLNLNPTGSFDVAANSATIKAKTVLGIESQGTIAAFARGSFSAGSTEGGAVIAASRDVGVESKNGRVIAESKGKMSFVSATALSISGGGLVSVLGGNVALDSKSGQVLVQKKASVPGEPQKTIVLAGGSSLA